MSELYTIIVLGCLTFFAVVTLVGIFLTKTKGFGKYTNSLLLLVVAMFLVSFFLVLEKVPSTAFINILFVATGFGGGLLSSKKLDES